VVIGSGEIARGLLGAVEALLAAVGQLRPRNARTTLPTPAMNKREFIPLSSSLSDLTPELRLS
jgi:hypothetical protein